MKKILLIMFSLLTIFSVEAGHGGAVAGGLFGGLALGAIIGAAARNNDVVEREVVYVYPDGSEFVEIEEEYIPPAQYRENRRSRRKYQEAPQRPRTARESKARNNRR